MTGAQEREGEWRAGVQIRSLGRRLLLMTKELPAAGTWVEPLVLLERQKEGEDSGDSSMHRLPPPPCDLQFEVLKEMVSV